MKSIKNIKSRQNRRLQQAKMQRKIRNSQKQIDSLRVLLKLMIIFFLIMLGYYILKSPQWKLNESVFNSLNNPYLEITNNKIVSTQKILFALRRNQVPNKPIFLVKTDNLKKSIMHLEPVKNVYIRRFWYPARLQIIIIESEPLITISPDIDIDPIAYFSKEGKLIGRDYLPLDNGYNVVKVVTYGKEDDYKNWDKTKVMNFKKLANIVEHESGEKVEYIDYRNPKDVYIKIPTANIRLGSFNSANFDKINRLPSLLPQVKMLNKKIKYIDLRWDSNYIKLDE